MKLGPITIGEVDEWAPGPGRVTSWSATPAARAKAQQAPVSDVPVSYMQAQHLRGYYEQRQKGLEYSRLLIATCDLPSGHCDLRAMNYVINTHLRRHDTYRSWFEYQDADHIVRHTMPDARDIAFVPTDHGEMSGDELVDLILATPDPLQWDCFSYGVTQRADNFSFYVAIDHLHMDAMFVAVILMEFQMMYAALLSGSAPINLPPAGSYDEFCVRQHEDAAELSLESPQVQKWVRFAERNGGTMPEFPLPLGDPEKPSTADLYNVTLMTQAQTHKFEAACVAAGARFIGGVLGCAALVERELTGADTYYGLTPCDTRTTPDDFLTLGWFTGMIPITAPTSSFAEAARAAQQCFDSGTDIANVPYYRVLELAPWLRRPRANFPVVNFFDSGVAPLSAFLTADLGGLNVGIYSDGRYSYQLSVFVVRLEKETAVSVMCPDNPAARESVTRYVEALKSMLVRVAEGRAAPAARSVLA